MIASSFLLLALAVTLQDDDEPWEAVRFKEGGFTIEMPVGSVQEGTTSFGSPYGPGELHEHLRQPGDMIYQVRRYVSPRTIARPDQGRWMDFGRDKAAGMFLGKVVSEKKFELGPVSGREYELRNGDQGPITTRGRAIVKGPVLIVLLATSGRGNQPLPPKAGRFLDSFAFGTKPSEAGKATARAGEEAEDRRVIQAGWKSVTIAKDQATVEMPKETSMTLGGNLDEPLRGFFCFTTNARYPGVDFSSLVFQSEKGLPAPDNDQCLKVARDQATMHYGSNAKVVSEKAVQAKAGAGREFELTLERRAGLTYPAKGRFYVDGGKAFVLLAVSRIKDKMLPPDADRFLDSFALKPRGGDSVAATGSASGSGEPPKGWGKEVDPDGDVELKQMGPALTLKIPGTAHVLAPERDRMNAPRVLAPIRGDFVVTVRVAGTFQPGDKSTVKGLSSRQAGGLILWKDARNYLVFQHRASSADEGKDTHQAVLEELVGGGKGVTNRQPVAEGAVWLRLDRVQGRITAEFSPDGKSWKALKPVEASWSEGEIQVGVVAVNTSTVPHAVTFDGYAVKSK